MNEGVLNSEFLFLIFALLLAVISNGIAFWNGFYTFPKVNSFRKVSRQTSSYDPVKSNVGSHFVSAGFPFPSLTHVFLVFLAFFALQIVIVPVVTNLGFVLLTSEKLDFTRQISVNHQVWNNIASILISAPLLWMFAYEIEPALVRLISGFDRFESRWLTIGSNLLIGVNAWFVAFPIGMALGMAMKIIVDYSFDPPETDQVAVRLFKKMMSSQWQYILGFIGIVIAVPIAEELIFRGFLQSWLKKKMEIGPAIIITSFLFALLHYSASHGWINLQILPTLFMLSCFLGFLFERQGSLWAPVGLHATFNLVSVSMITLSGE